VAPERIDDCSSHLSDEILDAFSVAGTPDDCARRLLRVAASGAAELALVALPAPGQRVEDLARRLATEVLPIVRDELGRSTG
jgi:5,10-methylenetetrahydromethanopterin reductase